MHKHFHVYTGNAAGMLIAETEYEHAEDSINTFMGVCNGIVGEEIFVPGSVAERALYHAAETENHAAIYLDAGFIKIYWSVCHIMCQTYLRN